MKILLVQLSFIGDTILSTPVIKGLKLIYPDSSISILTTPLSSYLIKNDPLVDEIIVYDKRKKDKGILKLIKKANQIKQKKFDKVYSIHRSHRTATLLFLTRIPDRIGFKDASMSFLYTDQRQKKLNAHAAIRNLSLLFKDLPEEKHDSRLRLFAPENQNISHLLKALPENYIVMAPGSAWKTKQWHWQGYLKVAEYYIKKSMDVILTGGDQDSEVCNKIKQSSKVHDLSGQVDLSETMYIIKKARLLICNDSMSLHMASAFQTPVVTVFCATSPEFGFGPWQNENARIVQDESLECKPCRRHGSMKCPTGTEACMTIPAETVINVCKEFL